MLGQEEKVKTKSRVKGNDNQEDEVKLSTTRDEQISTKLFSTIMEN